MEMPLDPQKLRYNSSGVGSKSFPGDYCVQPGSGVSGPVESPGSLLEMQSPRLYPAPLTGQNLHFQQTAQLF